MANTHTATIRAIEQRADTVLAEIRDLAIALYRTTPGRATDPRKKALATIELRCLELADDLATDLAHLPASRKPAIKSRVTVSTYH